MIPHRRWRSGRGRVGRPVRARAAESSQRPGWAPPAAINNAPSLSITKETMSEKYFGPAKTREDSLFDIINFQKKNYLTSPNNFGPFLFSTISFLVWPRFYLSFSS